LGRAGIVALAAVGRERENPRSERSEPAALKVQLPEVGQWGEGAPSPESGYRRCCWSGAPGYLERKLQEALGKLERLVDGWHFGGAKPNPHLLLFWLFKGIRRKQIVTTPTYGLLGAEPANFG